MAGPRLPKGAYEKIAEMRERGASIERIAKDFGVSCGCIGWHCLRMGVEPPKPPALRKNAGPNEVVRGGHVVRRFTEEEDEMILALEAAGQSIREIARATGRKDNSIRGRLYTLARYEARAEEGAGQ